MKCLNTSKTCLHTIGRPLRHPKYLVLKGRFHDAFYVASAPKPYDLSILWFLSIPSLAKVGITTDLPEPNACKETMLLLHLEQEKFPCPVLNIGSMSGTTAN